MMLNSILKIKERMKFKEVNSLAMVQYLKIIDCWPGLFGDLVNNPLFSNIGHLLAHEPTHKIIMMTQWSSCKTGFFPSIF